MGIVCRLQLRQLGCLVGLCSLVLLAGCAGVSSGSPPSSPSGPSAGQLSVSPAALNFGTVALGSSANLTGTLTAANADVNVSSAGWNGQGFAVSGITFPFTVTSGKSVNYTVTFAPQAAGNSAGSISFVHDASSSPLTQTLAGVGAPAGAHTVALSWNASTSTVIGYNIYRGTQSGGPYQLLNASPEANTNYSDNTVLNGTTYYYVAKSVDSNSVESVPSNEAQAVIPQQ